MLDLSLHVYRNLTSEQERDEFRTAMESQGYYAFFRFVEDFRQWLKEYDDAEAIEIARLLAICRSDFPNAGRFSPSWAAIWDEFDDVYTVKNGAMAQIPYSERQGEWQVLIDNPYLPQQVVCYPGLEFLDAAYMYAYFQKELKPNEILRLQKVTHLLVTSGSKEASLLPDV